MAQKKASENLDAETIREAIRNSDDSAERYLTLNKMASLGALLGGVAHTFNNILGGILGYAQLLGEDLQGNEDALRHAAVIEKAAKRASKLVYQLQIIANKKPLRLQPLEINRVVQEVSVILENTLNKSIRLKTDFATENTYVRGDFVLLCQALLNVCLNARQAMPDGGEILLQTRPTVLEIPDDKNHLQEQNAVEITVQDDGCGIRAEHLPFVFEPFFSTRDVHNGAGMGLTVVREIIDRHRGKVGIESIEGRGTTVKLFLPAQGRSSGAEPKRAQQERSRTPFNGEVILVVDDEKDLLGMARRIFEKKGCRVLLAGTGQEAIEMVQNHKNDIAVVILDMILPETDGAKVYRQVKELAPGLKVILTSGYNSTFNYDELIQGEHDIFMQKPWKLPDLIRETRRLLDED